MWSLTEVCIRCIKIKIVTSVMPVLDQATDGSLASENWQLNMDICDMVNESEEAAKDAFKTIRKKLQQYAGKNYQVVMYTLIVSNYFSSTILT